MTVKFRSAPDATVVTGAAGWLGTALMHGVTEVGSAWNREGRIRALVSNRVEAERLRGLGTQIEPIIADLTQPESLTPLMAGLAGTIDVIHAAGVIHPKRLADFTAVNVGGTQAMLTLASRQGVRRFVHVSSNSPFGTNPHPSDRFRNDEPYHPYYGYGRSKMEAELAVSAAVADGLDAVIVRPPWFYGPYQPPRQTKFFQLVRTGRFPVIGGGQQARSMAYVDNLVQGVVRANLVETPPGRGWWIADDRPYTVTEIVETVGRALTDAGYDVRPPKVAMPALVGRIAEFADSTLQRLGQYQQQIHVLGEMDKTIACDISVARDELGYDPQVELYEGMQRTIAWCQQQGLEL